MRRKPQPQGLYDPQYEHDACGVAFVASIAGERSHASSTSSANGGSGDGGAAATPSASTSSGGISVAAAIAINIQKASAKSYIGANTIYAGGAFTVAPFGMVAVFSTRTKLITTPTPMPAEPVALAAPLAIASP